MIAAAYPTVPPVFWGREALPPLDLTTLVITSPRGRKAAHDADLDLGSSRVMYPGAAGPAPVTDVERVVALGTGSIVDAGKVIAHQAGLPVIVVPTVLSTDAPFSTVAAVHHGEVVTYLDTGTPDRVVLDPALLAQAPWRLHVHGLGDLLAIESATRDWQACSTTHGQGLRAAARALVSTALEHTALWHRPSESGWALLVELLRTKVALGLLAGNPWAEEGTEHYLAYILEQHLDTGVWHGELLGACLPVCAILQNWDPPTVEAFRRVVPHLPGHRAGGGHLLPAGVVRTALAELPGYCRRHGLTNTILHAVDELDPLVLDRAIGAWERGW